MTNAPRTQDWRAIPAVPPGFAEAVKVSRAALSEYLADAFERAFGVRPDEIFYESFPEGTFAGLLTDGRLGTEHNVWAVMISTALRDAGVNVNVFVRARSELEEAERQHRSAEDDVRGRIRNRRKRV